MSIDWDALVLGPVHRTFVEPVTYQPVSGPANPALTGVFDEGYQSRIELEDGSVSWTTQAPTLGIRLAEWGGAPQQGETVTIPSVGKTFIVVDARPDGHGEIRLILGSVS